MCIWTAGFKEAGVWFDQQVCFAKQSVLVRLLPAGLNQYLIWLVKQQGSQQDIAAVGQQSIAHSHAIPLHHTTPAQHP
jgi:hypothetical protein